MKKIRVNIILDEPLYQEFKSRCEWAGKGMATVVRDIIAREMASPVETRDKKKEPDPVAAVFMREMHETRNRDIIERRKNGERPSDLAAEYGLSKSAISKIVARAKDA